MFVPTHCFHALGFICKFICKLVLSCSSINWIDPLSGICELACARIFFAVVHLTCFWEISNLISWTALVQDFIIICQFVSFCSPKNKQQDRFYHASRALEKLCWIRTFILTGSSLDRNVWYSFCSFSYSRLYSRKNSLIKLCVKASLRLNTL